MICVSKDVKFKENETWDWKEYINEHINDEPEWTDFKIGNLEVTNEHHDQGIQPIEEDNEFPNNDDVGYASPTRESPTHSQAPHTPSTRSSQVFKTKKDANRNINKHKARLVAKGYIQEHGIYFEEVFAPVARMETIRLLLAIAANNKWEVHHLDVKSAFLHGDLKEYVYVTQPEGYIKRQDNGKVYRLIKALYGLRQAPRAWNIKIDNTLKSLDFKKYALEQAIHTKTSKDSTLLIGVYVDDLIITGTPKKEIDKFKAQMEEKFEMSDLGLLAYYLGIEVTQTDGDISIKQSAYANKILKEARMLDCNETLLPMDLGTRLTKVIEGAMVNSTEYQSLIGCLRYLLHIRPGLSYSVGLLSRFINSSSNTSIMVKETAKQAYTLSRRESYTKVDNKSAIALMKNPVFHRISKHIDTKYHFIRECAEREDIQVKFVAHTFQVLTNGSKERCEDCKQEEDEEGGEPVVREEAKVVWDWWSFATKEGCTQICEMATSCEDSEEE
uniref:Ribonuclease H-like domain, reverse transcriptase, RNA-dependent DNA polymerase n=1 Tax=Tanacetum cinerariifolium TaxID=118510 RepID=A0A699IBX0_TANCI|nr:ribonuclease H-like domain, reverse transcriptase, RNA-dependent DNA polymerase [Tanacetum cinerariifolium]